MDTVLITGASTGLGLAIARLLMQHDYHLVLTARPGSMSRFAEAGLVEGEGLWLRPLDVVESDQRRAIVDEIDEKLGGVDVLINNAGVSYRAVAEHVCEHNRLDQMGVNFRAPMDLTRMVLPSMRRKRRGRILHVSSTGGMMAMPTMSVYSASKFALEGASEALWYEVRPWNIHVSLVQPGFIRSDAFQKVKTTGLSGDAIEDPDNPYHAHYRFMAPFIERVMRFAPSNEARVAKKVLRTMRKRRPALRVPATPDAWFFHMLRRLLPRSFYHRLLYASLPSVSEWGPKGD